MAPRAGCAPTSRSCRFSARRAPAPTTGTRFGWFVSYSDTPQGALVTVFFLEGGRPTFGPRAAELTGEFYKNLWDRNYFVGKPAEIQAGLPATSGATAQ